MNILIFGGNGQLGRDCRTVFENDHSVVAVDIDTLDITNIGAVRELIRQVQPEVLINCAAFTQVDKCETQKEAAWAANVTGPENLAICAKESKTRLIHISTDYVFDGKKKPPEPYIESDAVNPLSYYGKTKLEGERAIESHTDNFVILRTAWLYGFYGNNFLKTILRKALSGAPLKVINDQYGSPTWSFRLACQIKRVVENTAQGIYHATSEGHCTWFELAKYFLEKMNVPHDIKPCRTDEYTTPAVRPGNSILENRRLKAEGFNIMKHWQEELDEFIGKFGKQLKECGG
jgi:dTDP-4-dehydrorhamnose reductase